MRSKIRFICLAAAIGITAPMSVAEASPITETFDFTGTGFGPAGGPLSSLLGSFTITFDPNVSQAFTTSGIVENSLNLPVASVGFQYNPNANNGNLIIGGSLNGVNVVGGTNDFAAILFQVKTPTLAMGGAQYSTTASSQVYGELFQGTASATPVPEPLTLSLFGAGLAGIGVVRRRRKPAKQL